MRSLTVDVDGPTHVADFGGEGLPMTLVPGLGGLHANWLTSMGGVTVWSACGRRLGRLICGPTWDLHVFVDTGHLPMLEAPAEFVRVVQSWVERRPAYSRAAHAGSVALAG